MITGNIEMNKMILNVTYKGFLSIVLVVCAVNVSEILSFILLNPYLGIHFGLLLTK